MAAEKQDPEAPKQPAKGGGGGMIPALLVIVLMPVLSFAMFKFMFIPMIKAEMPDPAQAQQIKQENIVIEHDGGEAKYSAPFDNVVTNVKGTSQTRYIQVSFTVYSAYPTLPTEVDANKARMMDVANTVLGNLTLADLEKREIKNIVRNQLKQGFNHVMGKPMIEEIYFSQFVVQ